MIFQLGDGQEFIFNLQDQQQQQQQQIPGLGEQILIPGGDDGGIPGIILAQDQQQQQQQQIPENYIMNQMFGQQHQIPQPLIAMGGQVEQGQGEGGGAVGVDLGDANNNDRPDDFNNNTTDPEMQMRQNLRQLQIQQQQQRQQQQQLEQRQQEDVGEGGNEDNIPSAIVNIALTEIDSPFIMDNKIDGGGGGGGKGKKDKRKKKKKKKRNRLVTIIGADGSFTKIEPGDEPRENGVRDENDEPDENIEIE